MTMNTGIFKLFGDICKQMQRIVYYATLIFNATRGLFARLKDNRTLISLGYKAAPFELFPCAPVDHKRLPARLSAIPL